MRSVTFKGGVCAVVGAQFGSEGKGVVVNHIARKYGAHVRTGGPNAGHTFFHEGRVHKVQQLPCGWTNPGASLVIGPGAVLNMDILNAEVDLVEEMGYNVRDRVFIDARAGILTEAHHLEEGGVDGEIHQRIGSTGEGVGACRHARMFRNPEKFRQYDDIADTHSYPSMLTDRFLERSPTILLEGTQGFGLSLTHGEWPKVTSSDTTAAQLLADAGVAPTRLDRVILVARSMPIRVAGNSGNLAGETTWEQLSARLGRTVLERTTVTKKVRRIGHWDHDLMDAAVRVNGATEIALTFADYIAPEDHMVTEYGKLSGPTRAFVEGMEDQYGIPVTYIGTGFSDKTGWSVVDRSEDPRSR